MKYLLPLLLATSALAVDVEIGVDNGRTNVVDGLERALFSVKFDANGNASPDKLLTPWTTELTVTIPATNRGEILVLGETNKVLRTLGFFDPISTQASVPQNLSGKVFIRSK